MRLVDLDPHWCTVGDGRSGMGVSFQCPKCERRLSVWFANPLDGGPPATPDLTPVARWKRSGETFETLSLSPSVDASVSDDPCALDANGKPTRHWHGFITDGAIT